LVYASRWETRYKNVLHWSHFSQQISQEYFKSDSTTCFGKTQTISRTPASKKFSEHPAHKNIILLGILRSYSLRNKAAHSNETFLQNLIMFTKSSITTYKSECR
jgi:hypothetical protein